MENLWYIKIMGNTVLQVFVLYILILYVIWVNLIDGSSKIWENEPQKDVKLI